MAMSAPLPSAYASGDDVGWRAPEPAGGGAPSPSLPLLLLLLLVPDVPVLMSAARKESSLPKTSCDALRVSVDEWEVRGATRRRVMTCAALS